MQKTATLTYDDAGNRIGESVQTQGVATAATKAFAWDAQDRLLGVTMPDGSEHSYEYDYRTRRIGTSSTTGAGQATVTKRTAIVFSGGLSVAEWESDTGSLPAAPTVEYTRGPDMGGGVGGLLYSLRSESGTTTAKYNLSNGRGDIVAQSNQSAALTWTASYEAYGKRTKESGTNKDKQRGNSKDEDPTGLLNEGFRYRDLETGVWLSRDPAGFVDGPNVYAYVKQNPWSKYDPLGLRISNRKVPWSDTDHHIVPLNRANANDFDDELQKELNKRTMKTDEPHGRAAHGEYDRRVQQVIDQYKGEVAKNGIDLSAKMTHEQAVKYADELVGKIKSSSDGYLSGYLKRVSHLTQNELKEWGWGYRFAEAKGASDLAGFIKKSDGAFGKAFKNIVGKMLSVAPYGLNVLLAMGDHAEAVKNRNAMNKILTEQEGMSPEQASYVRSKLIQAEERMKSFQIDRTGFPDLNSSQERDLLDMQMDPQGVLRGTNNAARYYAPDLQI